MILLEWRVRAGINGLTFSLTATTDSHVPPPSDPFYAGLGQAVRIGTELLAALIVGGGLGWLIDTYLLSSTPWGIVVGLVLGAIAGVRNAYQRAQSWSGGR